MLPSWAVPHPTDKNAVLVDPDLAYPALLKERGITTPTNFDIEVAYQFIKMDLQRAMGRFDFTIHIRSDGDRKQRWNLTMFPGGTGFIFAATKQMHARRIYKEIRGKLP